MVEERVTNGSFESGLTGWSSDPTEYADSWGFYHYEGPGCWTDYEQAAYYAGYYCSLGVFPGLKGVWQTIDLTNVDTLTFEFNTWLYTFEGGHPFFRVTIDGTPVFTVTEGWDLTESVEIDVSAYTGSHVVKFGIDANEWTADFTIHKISALAGATPTPPVADFTAAPLSGDHPLPVQFYDLSTNSPTSWLWDFGDGHLSSAQNPEHIYMAAGSYTVSLRVENDDGWDYKSVPGYITVTEPPPPPPVFFPEWIFQIGPL